MILSKMGPQLFPQCFHSANTAGLGQTSHCSATRADCSERICCASSTASCSRPASNSQTKQDKQGIIRHAAWIFLGVYSFLSAVHWNQIYKVRAFQCMSSVSSWILILLILIQTWHSCVICVMLGLRDSETQSPACSDLCSDSSARSTHGTDPHSRKGRRHGGVMGQSLRMKLFGRQA